MENRRTSEHLMGVILLLSPKVLWTFGELSNVALNKAASQSTNETTWLAHLAVDGDPNPDAHQHKCSSTNGWLQGNMNAWWKVDVGDEYRIKAINIQNRGDCCGERLRNLSIQIGTVEDELKQVFFFDGPGYNRSYHEFPIANVIGRYVKLEIDNTMDAIVTLCEVEVMATDIRRGGLFNKIEERKSSGSSLGEFSATSILQCSTFCLQQSGCTAANYDVLNSSCQLLTSSEPSITATGYTLIVVN